MTQEAKTPAKIIIKHRFTDAVLYEFQPTEEQQTSGLAMRAALEAATGSGADLRGADLSGAVLRGADLSGAVLSGADLSDADLSGAVLSGAVLRGAVLSGAVLRDADLRGAVLSGAVLRGADLRDADLRGADLSDADLRGADLRGADLSGAVLSGADLSGAVLSGADLRGAVLRGADLSGAVLRGADLQLGDDVPVLPNIHQQVYEAASTPNALDMGSWHGYCGTTHCRAGWVVTLAGEEGKKLESRMGTAGAAMAIYLKSDPKRWAKDSDERLPDFYCGNEKALADMKRLADEEVAKAAQ